jgi:hypothetical protein
VVSARNWLRACTYPSRFNKSTLFRPVGNDVLALRERRNRLIINVLVNKLGPDPTQAERSSPAPKPSFCPRTRVCTCTDQGERSPHSNKTKSPASAKLFGSPPLLLRRTAGRLRQGYGVSLIAYACPSRSFGQRGKASAYH